MIISTNQELRLHVPSNAIDDIATIQGILDNSEKDVLKDKLGASLYNRLCEEYKKLDPLDFYNHVQDGTYIQYPWEELLLNAQRVVANEAMARFAYQQVISINGAGVNIASSNDYDAASEKLLDKGVAGYKKEAMVSLNNLLLMLENMAKMVKTSAKIAGTNNTEHADSESSETPKNESSEVQKDDSTNVPKNNNTNVPKSDSTKGDDTKGDGDTEGTPSQPTKDEIHAALEDIILLWQESRYYYLHHDLLIPTCEIMQQYLDIYDSRDKFIRLIPDMLFIQSEYLEEAFGEDFIPRLLQADENDKMLKKARQLVVAYLKERTSVINFDKLARSTAHNDAVTVRESIHRLLKKEEAEAQAKLDAAKADSATEGGNSSSSTSNASGVSPSGSKDSNEGYENNQKGSRIFVTPILC
jgi:hypothetical protein